MSAPDREQPARRLTHREVERVRHLRGRSILLFVTDRCPVGCLHCSVSSRRDSPTITDFALFEDIVGWICAQDDLGMVGLSGGEPFVERRGLTLACERLSAAGKDLVVFTSGTWARSAAAVPRWIGEVLARVSCVYLSTDSFHAAYVSDDDFLRAAHAIVSSGSWLVVQGVDHGDTGVRIRRLLEKGFGGDWRRHADINLVAPLANGRGANIFSRQAGTAGRDFGPCSLVRAPMVRYDGVVTACCNENVIMGLGPQRLRRQARAAHEVDAAVRQFHADDTLQLIGNAGFGVLTEHPHLADLAERRFATNCELCWKALARQPEPGAPDRLIAAMAGLSREMVA